MPEGGGGTGQGISGNKEETITGGKNAGWYMKEGGKGVRLRDDIRERPEKQISPAGGPAVGLAEVSMLQPLVRNLN